MWVIFQKTYQGRFLKGQKYDLWPDTLKRIPQDFWRKTCAPWDEKKDRKAIKLAKLEAEAKETKQHAEQLTTKAEQAHQTAGQQLTEAGAETMKAKESKDKRKILESEKRLCEARAANIAANLLTMDAEDAQRSAEKAATALDRFKQKQAAAKANADAKAKAQKQQE